MVGRNNQCFNFSDNSSRVSPSIPNWYFADKFKKPALLYNDLRLLEARNYNWNHRLLPMVMVFCGRIDPDA